ncbi:MAG: hypothetical protein MZV63_66430 [Marinilabiliales bacterium]|nr:hypothetical protein [Marinilabiliales bacterium]
MRMPGRRPFSIRAARAAAAAVGSAVWAAGEAAPAPAAIVIAMTRMERTVVRRPVDFTNHLTGRMGRMGVRSRTDTRSGRERFPFGPLIPRPARRVSTSGKCGSIRPAWPRRRASRRPRGRPWCRRPWRRRSCRPGWARRRRRRPRP